MSQSFEPRHPIKVASSRTGLPASVLRTWERRYGAVEPKRTETGRRSYSDEEIRRLSLIRQAVDGGRAVGEVATIPTEELERLVQGDAEARSQGIPETESSAEERFARARSLLELLDDGGPEAFGASLRREALDGSGRGWGHALVGPLLEELGSGGVGAAPRPGAPSSPGGRPGTSVVPGLRGYQALEEIRGFLEWVAQGYPVASNQPTASIIGREGALDDVCGRYLAVQVRQEGWDAPLLSAGAGYPGLEGLQSATNAGLVVVVAQGSRFTAAEVAPLIDARRRIPEWVDVAVAGPGARPLGDAWKVGGIVVVDSLDQVRALAREVYRRRYGAWDWERTFAR